MSKKIIRSRTIYSTRLQTGLLFGLTTTPVANTTLNELWTIHNQSTPNPANGAPKVQYIAIGRGGHRMVVGADSNPYVSPIPHRSSDAGLYDPLPFIVRPVASDLTDTERQNYGMRVPITVNNANYWAYYLKRLDTTNVVPEMTKTVINAGVPTTTPFVPDNSNLTPIPPEIPNTGSNPTSGDYLSVVAVIDATLNEATVAEIAAACEILYGSSDSANISEFAFVSGVRSNVAVLDFNKQPTSGMYFECLQAMINFFVGGFWPLAFNDKVSVTIKGGGSTPLLGPTQTSTIPGP